MGFAKPAVGKWSKRASAAMLAGDSARGPTMDDESIKNLFLCSVVLLGAALFVGGYVYRVAGTWSDGARRITLHQLGPVVWGESHFDAGRQLFSGRMVFGYLKLGRRDFGDDHLRSLGFTKEHLDAMQGATTGFFKMRLGAEGRLDGHFVGRTFTTRQNKMVPTTWAEPSPRSWQREA